MLDENGKKLLSLLVSRLPKTIPGSPETFIGYKECHQALGLEQLDSIWGDSLKLQGLSSLANWTKEEGMPAITGVIIKKLTYEPGVGYFNLFEKSHEDYDWWKNEIQKSKNFDWSPYIDLEFSQKPIDIEAPERVDTKISRIIRDNQLSKEVKLINNYECQICGLTLHMPENQKYAEAHHIKPLGKPHNGPDIKENIICVCPNHHAELDYGAIKLILNTLKLKPIHQISNEFIEYHNSKIYKK